MEGVDPLVDRVAKALLDRAPELRAVHHRHMRVDANAAYSIAEIAVAEMKANPAPWPWGSSTDGPPVPSLGDVAPLRPCPVCVASHYGPLVPPPHDCPNSKET